MINGDFDEVLPDEVMNNLDDIAALLGHKACLYDFFSEHLGKLLPDRSSCDVKFLLQLLTNEKRAIEKANVEGLDLPENLGVTREQLQRYVMQHDTMKFFVPDVLPCNREFLIRLIAFHDRATLNKLIEISGKSRFDLASNAKGPARLLVRKEYGKIMLGMPMFTSKGQYNIKPNTRQSEDDFRRVLASERTTRRFPEFTQPMQSISHYISPQYRQQEETANQNGRKHEDFK